MATPDDTSTLQSRPETEPTDPNKRHSRHRSSKHHSSKKTSKKHSQMQVDIGDAEDIQPLELKQEIGAVYDQVLVEDEGEEQDTIEPLQVPSIKQQKTRKSRKSAVNKQGSQRRLASLVNPANAGLYADPNAALAHQYSLSRMITPGFSEMENGGESPSQNRLFPQYTRDDLEAMLISYQHNR